MHRHRGEAGAGDGLEPAMKGHRLLGPQAAHERDLLADPARPAREVLAESLVLDRVPPDPDTETQASLREQVDLCRLFGDEGALALREDHDPGDELEARQGRQVAEEDERLVEGAVQVVGPVPASVHGRIGADHVIVGEDVAVAEVGDGLGVATQPPGVRAGLGLGEHDADLHAAPACLVGSLGRHASRTSGAA